MLNLIILNNLENLNAELIELGMPQGERLRRLNSSEKTQVALLQDNANVKELDTNK